LLNRWIHLLESNFAVALARARNGIRHEFSQNSLKRATLKISAKPWTSISVGSAMGFIWVIPLRSYLAAKLINED
jgi:ElaB/YqjD/DUF883 family membrane-anchored ribosome-binding protein